MEFLLGDSVERSLADGWRILVPAPCPDRSTVGTDFRAPFRESLEAGANCRSVRHLAVCCALWLCLGVPGPARDGRLRLRVDSFPSGALVYLETSSGRTLLGTAGTDMPVEPPSLHDASGQITQFTAGSLTLTLPGHQNLRVSVAPEEWELGRLPASGSWKLAADNPWIAFQDYLKAYPVLVVGSLLGAFFTLTIALRWRRTMGTQRVQLRSLLGRLRSEGDPLLGKSLGEYTVESRLGQGGMGTVYKVRNEAGEPFAAKVFYADPSALENEARFRREARLVAQLHHPNLIRSYDFGEQPGLVYYVMEWVQGATLEGQVRPQGRPWAEVWQLVRPVVEALECAHKSGIVHRDLKPANIMLSHNGQIKVLDFGLAREHARTAITRTGHGMGTPTYLAPEQVSASGAEVEPRTDQYSLGIILFELLTGVPPFESEEVERLIGMHMLSPAPPLRSRRPDLPATLERAVARMLEKDPARRFVDMAAVRIALEAVETGSAGPGAQTQSPPRPPEPTVDLRPKR